ncbi:MAG TPA: pseudouridine synthase, partial [Thermoanaerobaculia bacterium]|nr:pseudouridine synthase [Thermoanaerobaculia bacterium]
LRPGIVHRLDRDTSGVLLVGKTDLAHASLSRQMKRRTMKKEYLALAADSLQAAHVVEQRVDESARAVARRGVHHEPRRLVDGEEVSVFVEDREGNVLRKDLGASRLRHLDLDDLSHVQHM